MRTEEQKTTSIYALILCAQWCSFGDFLVIYCNIPSNKLQEIQGGSNMTGTDLYVNKPHCAAAVRP